jgi:hypothetical protein
MDLSLIIYSSQDYLPLAKTCAEIFNEKPEDLNIPKFIVSNKIPNTNVVSNLGFELIDTNIELKSDKSQFQEVLLKSLETINTKYIMLFLEDYWLVNKFKTNNLEKVMNLVEDNNIDYLSLMSYGYGDWETYPADYSKYDLPDNTILKFDERHLHMYSVQPCIWKKSSLIELLNHNPKLTMVDMDTTRVRNKKGQRREGEDSYGLWTTPNDFWDYGFQHCCFDRRSDTAFFTFDEHDGVSDYLIFQYSEIGRGGKFNFNAGSNNRIFLQRVLPERNITPENELYSRYF